MEEPGTYRSEVRARNRLTARERPPVGPHVEHRFRGAQRHRRPDANLTHARNGCDLELHPLEQRLRVLVLPRLEVERYFHRQDVLRGETGVHFGEL